MACRRGARHFGRRLGTDCRAVAPWYRLVRRYRCVRVRRPGSRELTSLAERASAEPYTYTAVGATAQARWPDGYRHDRESVVLRDASEFDAAVTRLRERLGIRECVSTDRIKDLPAILRKYGAAA